jgi:hypothetical protein
MKVVGLTSKGNMAFTKRLGLYDDIVVYDEIGNVNVGKDRWIYVDIAANEDVNKKVASHFGGQLVANVALGFTNLSPSLSSSSTSPEWTTNTFKLQDTPSPSSAASTQEGFFLGEFVRVPASTSHLSLYLSVEWLNVRKHQISAKTTFEMQNQAWRELLEDGKEWVKLERVMARVM